MPLDPHEVQTETVRYLVAKNQELAAEVARLQSGGCARDQGLTQFCAEAVARDAEIRRLRSELAAAPEAARRWSAIREAVATVHAATGFAGDVPLTDDAVAELLAEAIQNAARVHTAETALRTDAEAHSKATAHLRGLVDGQRARAERAEAELAAAQAGPVVEWRHLPGSAGWERADVGQFSLLLMGDSAWRLVCGDQAVIARGSPGGDAGKAAAVAAYRRACGFPTIPPCAG
jgi:hypothetical protein